MQTLSLVLHDTETKRNVAQHWDLEKILALPAQGPAFENELRKLVDQLNAPLPEPVPATTAPANLPGSDPVPTAKSAPKGKRV